MGSYVSPNVLNETIFKGIVSFQANATGPYVDMGNAPAFKLTPQVEEIEHYSSRTGTKELDNVITRQIGGQVEFSLDEASLENIALSLLGSVTVPTGATAPTGSTPGSGRVVEIMATPVIRGVLRVVGTNSQGTQITADGVFVQIKPTSGIDLIGDDISKLDFTCRWMINPAPVTGASVWGTITEH